jgi:Ca2+-binding EF-hand superfamily protein
VFSKLENCGYVDIYEAFVALTVFSFGDFDVKLLGLFRSFDTDNGGTIDKQEFLKFLQAAIQGLCKLLKLPIPTQGSILNYINIVYKEIDVDMSGEIDFEELKQWMKNSHDLQDFLLIYTGVQTFESAKRRFVEQLELY